MTFYTDGVSFFHYCVNDESYPPYYSAFYRMNSSKDYGARCFYEKCQFILPIFITLGNSNKRLPYAFWLTEDGDSRVFNQDNFNKSIYKAIEI